jgi:hypothetical protein
LRVALIVACGLALAGPARGGIVVGRAPSPGAAGLLVPWHGVTVTRAQALSALRGQSGPPGATVYVTLPPSRETENTRRYPVTVVGAGFHGTLTSDATRIPGLVSIRDLDGLRSRADSRPAATLRSLDRRLTAATNARNWATVTLMLSALALAGAALLARSRYLARAGVVALPAALSSALVLSALHSASLPALAVLTLGGALAAALLPLRLVLPAFLACYLVVLATWPDVNALAVIGPHPDGGGRFYGVTNEVETLLLPLALLGGPAAALLGLVGVGWSKAGADGGGLVVLAAALLALWLRPRWIALAAPLALALVGLDAALGGSDHVTRTVFHPLRLAHTLGHRWRISWDGVTATGHSALIAALTLAAVLMFAVLRPRHRELDALLVGIAVSLLVNDTAADVIGFGALSCAVLWTWVRLAPRCAGSPSQQPPSSRSRLPAAAARAWWRRPPRPS